MFETNFDKYTCLNDTIETLEGPFKIVATIHHDDETDTYDADCYSKDDIDRWNRDEWSFCGLILSVWLDDTQITASAVSLWGIALNISEDNDYLLTVANDLLQEAIDDGHDITEKLCAAYLEGKKHG